MYACEPFNLFILLLWEYAFNQSEAHFPYLVSNSLLVYMEFLRSLLRRHFAGKLRSGVLIFRGRAVAKEKGKKDHLIAGYGQTEVVALRNVGCFPRITGELLV